MSIFAQVANDLLSAKEEVYTLQEYLESARASSSFYATAPERMLTAIGEPTLVDTSKDPRLYRIFEGRTIKQYPAFKNFYGIEDSIERVVKFFKASAQGLEEKKQVLYLRGPVGSSKSSMAEELKRLIEHEPIYVLEHKGVLSPVFETPLGLFPYHKYAKRFESEWKIPARYLINLIPSPWALKRLREDGNLENFRVRRIYPNILNEQGVTKVEPGDDNNQDTSSLVGKVNIRRVGTHDQNDPDAYLYSGGLCRSNQGLLEFVEMFKAPIKVLHPLLTATQEGNYKGTESMPAMPFNGIVLAHSNISEFAAFRDNKANEAMLDRVNLIDFPYCKRIDEEVEIYKKLINTSSLTDAPLAPHTLKLLAEWSISTRLVEPENGSLYSKVRIYNGDNLKDIDPKAKPIREYRDAAGVDEGMTGMSTRFAFKIISKTFNADPEEVAADPLQMLSVLRDAIDHEHLAPDIASLYHAYGKEASARYLEHLTKDIQTAYLENAEDYCQNVFERYLELADAWVADLEFKNQQTNETLSRSEIDAELGKIEKTAGITNPKDYRSEVVNYVLRVRASNGGKMPRWNSYEKMRTVIEKKVSANMEELLPVISFDTKADSKLQKDHESFLARMEKLGYTPRQTRRAVEWYVRAKKSY